MDRATGQVNCYNDSYQINLATNQPGDTADTSSARLDDFAIGPISLYTF